MATLRETFKDIADAIREKGITGTMTPTEMPEKIGEISGGGEEDTVNYLTFTSTGDSTVCLSASGSPDAISLDVKVDDGDWTTYTVGTTLNLSDGQKVKWRGDNGAFAKSRSSNLYNFAMTGSIAASGSIMTLMDKTNALRTLPNYAFPKLFNNCIALTQAPELPATTLATACYYQMFYGCTSLQQAPKLPATTTTSYCYRGMFQNCTSLKTAPELPATTIEQNCYTYLFKGCTSLKTAPELPATTVNVYNCYCGMFDGCTALTQPPSTLPATTLGSCSYEAMFRNCTSLNVSPIINATTFYNSYDAHLMFSGCTSLSYIRVKFTSWPAIPAQEYGYAFYEWVSGLPSVGVFVCPTALGTNDTITRGVNYCPEGWTVVNIDA